MSKITIKPSKLTTNASLESCEKKIVTVAETALDKLLMKQSTGAPLELFELKILEILSKIVTDLQRTKKTEPPSELHQHIHASTEELKRLVAKDG